jgi:hypothetical protein
MILDVSHIGDVMSKYKKDDDLYKYLVSEKGKLILSYTL